MAAWPAGSDETVKNSMKCLRIKSNLLKNGEYEVETSKLTYY
jgi:hypothetical protein